MLGLLLKLHCNYRSFGGGPCKCFQRNDFWFSLSVYFYIVFFIPFDLSCVGPFLQLLLFYINTQSSGCLPAAFAAYYTLCTFLVSFGLKHFQISLGIAPLIFGSLEINSLIFFLNYLKNLANFS